MKLVFRHINRFTIRWEESRFWYNAGLFCLTLFFFSDSLIAWCEE